MTNVSIYIYWNKEILTPNFEIEEEISPYQLPSLISNGLEILQNDLKKSLEKFAEIKGEKSGLRMTMGRISVIIVVDKVEFCRMKSPEQVSLMYADKEMEMISRSIMRSLDLIVNKNRNCNDIEIETYHGTNKKFDSDKAFEGRFK